MKEGYYEFFAVQHRITGRSAWREPDGPIVPEDSDWSFSSYDFFGQIAEPRRRIGNQIVPKCRESYDELHSVWSITGHRAYWTLKFARRAVRRLRKADARGEFDTFDTDTRRHMQAVRHEFRVVKVRKSFRVVPLEEPALTA